MKLLKNGTNYLVEITNISACGIWLYVKDSEYFMPYSEFPWFKEANISQILNVEEISKNHFYWDDLDVDLTLEMIEKPEDYALKAK